MARVRSRLIRQTRTPSQRPIPSAPIPSGRHWYAHARQPLGWRCARGPHPAGEDCALVCRWWNLWGAFWGRTR